MCGVGAASVRRAAGRRRSSTSASPGSSAQPSPDPRASLCQSPFSTFLSQPRTVLCEASGSPLLSLRPRNPLLRSGQPSPEPCVDTSGNPLLSLGQSSAERRVKPGTMATCTHSLRRTPFCTHPFRRPLGAHPLRARILSASLRHRPPTRRHSCAMMVLVSHSSHSSSFTTHLHPHTHPLPPLTNSSTTSQTQPSQQALITRSPVVSCE